MKKLLLVCVNVITVLGTTLTLYADVSPQAVAVNSSPVIATYSMADNQSIAPAESDLIPAAEITDAENQNDTSVDVQILNNNPLLRSSSIPTSQYNNNGGVFTYNGEIMPNVTWVYTNYYFHPVNGVLYFDMSGLNNGGFVITVTCYEVGSNSAVTSYESTSRPNVKFYNLDNGKNYYFKIQAGGLFNDCSGKFSVYAN